MYKEPYLKYNDLSKRKCLVLNNQRFKMFKITTLSFSSDSVYAETFSEGYVYGMDGNKICLTVVDVSDDGETYFIATDMSDKNEVNGYYWAVGYMACSLSCENLELSTEEYEEIEEDQVETYIEELKQELSEE